MLRTFSKERKKYYSIWITNTQIKENTNTTMWEDSWEDCWERTRKWLGDNHNGRGQLHLFEQTLKTTYMLYCYFVFFLLCFNIRQSFSLGKAFSLSTWFKKEQKEEIYKVVCFFTISFKDFYIMRFFFFLKI